MNRPLSVDNIYLVILCNMAPNRGVFTEIRGAQQVATPQKCKHRANSALGAQKRGNVEPNFFNQPTKVTTRKPEFIHCRTSSTAPQLSNIQLIYSEDQRTVKAA